MEYLEGETLAERLSKGPLPLGQALAYAAQIADALDKAHRKGAIHRDVKPGNIMLTRGGAKLLDFGLAKLKQEAFEQPNVLLSQLAAPPSALTAEGTLLGTLQYMAPEQIEGRISELDARTDVFAFGAVVYEMTTGRKAFDGKSSASIIAEILAGNPPSITSLQPIAPPQLDRAVRKCLAKEPDERWQSAADLRDELKWIAADAATVASRSPSPSSPAAHRRSVLAAALACAAVGLLAGLTAWRLKPDPQSAPQPVSRLQVSLLPTERIAVQTPSVLALSPDGTQLAYVARRGPTAQLYLRSLSSAEGKPVAESQGASTPTFSEDGQWLAFIADRKLKKVSVSGGVPVTLGPAPFFGASWGPGDRLLVGGIAPALGVNEIPAAGGAPRALTEVDTQKGERMHNWAQLLPGARAVLFTIPLQESTRWDDSLVAVQLLETGERKILVRGYGRPLRAHGAPGLPAGRDADGRALRRLEAGDLRHARACRRRRDAERGRRRTLQLLPQRTPGLRARRRAGQDARVRRPPGCSTRPSAAPRVVSCTAHLARRAAPRRLGGGGELPLRGLRPRARGFDAAHRGRRQPRAHLDARWQAHRLQLDQVGAATAVLDARRRQRAERRARAGHELAGAELAYPGRKAPGVRRPRSHQPARHLAAAARRRAYAPSVPEDQLQRAVSELFPDGRSLAYVSDQSGQNEVYVQPYPGPGERWQISTDGGTEPLGVGTDASLHRNLDRVLVVPMRPGTGPGKPKLVFQGPYLFSGDVPALSSNRQYDVSPDGRTLLMIKSSERELAAAPILVVLNWFEELKRLAPARH